MHTATASGLDLGSAPTCVFSVDVEDWFHILDLPRGPVLSQWDSLPSHVERNFFRLLDLFSEHDTKVTCFFLGWVAKKFPHLVRVAEKRGNEVASHGYSHELSYRMTPGEFYRDAVASKRTIEDTLGHGILGYRAAGFSVNREAPWYFEKLAEAGYVYDSSLFPAARNHGGMPDGCLAPYVVSLPFGEIVEFPITVTKLLGRRICFSGGGYLRIFPLRFIRAMTSAVLAEGRPVVFYVHPREIDPDHPRLPMPLGRRFRCYVNLATTERKIRRLLRQFEFTTFQDMIARTPAQTRAAAIHASSR